MDSIGGRNPALWLGLAAAALNAAVIVFGVQLSAGQLAAIMAVVTALVGVVANEADPTTVGTFARTLGCPELPEPGTTSSGMGTSMTSTPASASTTDPTPDPPGRPPSWPPAL